MEQISQKDFWRVINLYNNEIELQKKIDSQNNNVLVEEYYLITMNWIENFKKVFQYDNIIASFPTKIINPIKLNNLPKIEIRKEDKKGLNILKNTNMLNNIKIEETNYSFYQSFYLISPKYYDKITDGYIIDERIKNNIYINKGMFILDLSKNMIEIALLETPYSYNALFLIRYKNILNSNEEIKKIFSNGVFGYLKQNDIPEDIFYESGEITKNNFNLIKLYLIDNLRKNSMKNISQKVIPISSKGLEINNKKGFINFNQESSKLNSIIQILTSIKEIYKYFTNSEINVNIKKFNHIYVFSSFFYETINEIFNNIISLKEMDILINFLSPSITKKELYELLNFILQTLHNELIPFPQNLNPENLESYDSPFNDRNNSLVQFNNYYFSNNNNNDNNDNSYKKSLISELFNWI